MRKWGGLRQKVRCGTALEMERQICYNGKKLRKEAICHENFNTGFDPFGGENVNPAYEAVKLLPDTIAGAEIIKLEVPTRFHRWTWNGFYLHDRNVQKCAPDVLWRCRYPYP